MPLPEGYDNKASGHTLDQERETLICLVSSVIPPTFFYVLTCRGEKFYQSCFCCSLILTDYPRFCYPHRKHAFNFDTLAFARPVANVFLKYNQELQSRIRVPSGFRYSNFYILISNFYILISEHKNK